MDHSRKVSEVNARDIKVQFSPAVTKAFGDLEEAVRGSEHFDWDAHRIIQDLAAETPKSLHSVLIGLPVIAEETIKYVRTTGDRRAELAWEDIAAQINENGFSLTQSRGRRK